MRHPEPFREIEFAAKFGFLSKRIWLENFAVGSKSWRSKQWSNLKDRGYFKPHPADPFGKVLILARSNPVVWKVSGGEPVRAPSIAQLVHDETLGLGTLKLIRDGVVSSYQTDAELRRLEYDWKAQAKLPDLVLEIGPRIVAIELELGQKSKDRYKKMVEAYRKRTQLTDIIFVVPSKTVMDAIMRSWAGIRLEGTELGFMKLQFWQNNPADSKIAFRNRYATLRSLNRI